MWYCYMNFWNGKVGVHVSFFFLRVCQVPSIFHDIDCKIPWIAILAQKYAVQKTWTPKVEAGNWVRCGCVNRLRVPMSVAG